VGGLVLAWMAGEAMIVWRWWKHKAPPPPGALLEASILFIAMAVLAEYQPARTSATMFAWGIDIAVLLQLVGKEPAVKTSWPPLCIPDTQLMPSKTGGVACGGSQGGTAATTKTTGKTRPFSASNPPTPADRAKAGQVPGAHG
jgi:hypothetical protein